MIDEKSETDVAKAETEPQIDQAMIQIAVENMKSEQNLLGGAIAGLVAAVAGAMIWAGVTVLTGYQIGWMAVGVGFIVGLANQKVGRGIDPIFGYIGAIIAFLGCILGNLLTIVHFLSIEVELGYFEVLSRLTPDIIIEVMTATFSPMDILFYGLAIYEGYKLSFRKITQNDLMPTGPVAEEPVLPV